ncbi:hypothetical protein HPP92_000622, partial [Vanilla planifolia]
VLVPIANGTEEMEAVIIIDTLRRAKANGGGITGRRTRNRGIQERRGFPVLRHSRSQKHVDLLKKQAGSVDSMEQYVLPQQWSLSPMAC